MSESGPSSDAVSAVPTEKPMNRQKMTQELKDLGLYEYGMSMTDMNIVLAAVRMSQETAAPSVQNAAAMMPPEPSTPPTKMCYAQVASVKSSGASERKSMSPELQSSQRSTKSLSQEKPVDSPEETLYSPVIGRNPFIKESKDSQASNANRSRSIIVESSPEVTPRENKRTNNRASYSLYQEEKNLKYKMNPWDPSIGRNDVPLEPHYRSFKNPDCKEGTSGDKNDNIDRAINRLSTHLRRISEIMHTQHGSSVNTIFQWGSAIKVGTANGSLDRKIVAHDSSPEVPVENVIVPEEENINEITRRRRACTVTKSYDCYGFESDENNDDNDKNENSDEDFQIDPKRKETLNSLITKKVSVTRSTRQKSNEPVTTSDLPVNTLLEKSNDSVVSTNILNLSDVITDDETNDEPPKKMQRSKSEEKSKSDFPRRIIPPKPASQRWTTFRLRKPLSGKSKPPTDADNKKNNDSVSSTIEISGNSSVGLMDSEIVEALENSENDEHNNDNENEANPMSNDHVEIKPLRVSGRIQLQSQHLVQLQEKEKEMEYKRREAERTREEMETREKTERAKKRRLEETERLRQQEEAERTAQRREEMWKMRMAQRDKGSPVERTELYPDGRSQNNNDATPNHVDIDCFTKNDNEAEFIRDNGRGTEAELLSMACPICNRNFPVDDIEAHAAACEEFDAPITPVANRSTSPSMSPIRTNTSLHLSASSTRLECAVCSTFTTYNGKEYENHVTACIRRKQYGPTNSSDMGVVVPTSPLRTVRTISEQTDSEINYKAQFVPKTKTTKSTTRKRKR